MAFSLFKEGIEEESPFFVDHFDDVHLMIRLYNDGIVTSFRCTGNYDIVFG